MDRDQPAAARCRCVLAAWPHWSSLATGSAAHLPFLPPASQSEVRTALCARSLPDYGSTVVIRKAVAAACGHTAWHCGRLEDLSSNLPAVFSSQKGSACCGRRRDRGGVIGGRIVTGIWTSTASHLCHPSVAVGIARRDSKSL